MKPSLLPLLLLFIPFVFATCCKRDIILPPTNNNIPGLPPATQSGANTLGFLLNGVPWTPVGNNSLTIDFDPGFNQGIVGIVAYQKNATNTTQIVLGIRDSLNSMFIPGYREIGRANLGFINYSNLFCEINQGSIDTYSNGRININKLDRTARIIAGSFEAVLFNPACGDTLRITNGRFDMKF